MSTLLCLFGATVLVPVLAATALAGGVPVFLGAPGGTGSVCIFDETLATPPQYPPALQGIRLLPLDVAGRTQIEELLPGRARWRDDVPLASRLELPGAQGSLYRFFRDDGATGVVHGLFLVDQQGAARAVLELSEPSSGVEPFLERVAVAPDGRAILVATAHAAGGNLLEIDLVSGAIIDRSSALAPQYFDGSGLGLQASWGVGISDSAILRFDRGQTGGAQAVPFAQPAPNWLARQVVFSRNGQYAATIAGDDPALAFAWVFCANDSAERASDTPAALSGAGFLPEVQGGPWLAVSDDGTLCAWKTGAGHAYSRELYLGRVPASPAEAPLHVTQDALFEPYLDEIGQYIFGPGGVLSFGAGDPEGLSPGALANMDVFQLRWPSGSGPELLNLSLSSGEAQPPFVTYPTLQPEHVAWLAGDEELLLYSSQGGIGDLLHVRLDHPGAQTVVAGASAYELLGPAEESLLFSQVHPQVSSDTGLRTLEVPIDEEPETLAALPPNQTFLHGVLDPAGARVGYVSGDGASEKLWRLDAEDGDVELLTPRPLHYGPTLTFTPKGSLALSVGQLGTPSLFVVWAASGPPLRLQPQAATGFILPGP